jgi:glycogen synthase
MHPGWAATPGVDEAIPGFAKTMEGRLRTPLQGADTILWLLSSKKKIESGALYFDRKKVSPHYFWFTKKREKQSLVLEKQLKDSLSGV